MGGLGAGKTLLTVMLASFEQLPIISNFKLSIPGKIHPPFELRKFLLAEYENCVIILDEAYAYLESRISSNKLNLLMSYILFQSRKKNVTLIITAQLFSSIDKRFRELSDIVIIAERLGTHFSYILYSANKCKRFTINYIKALQYFQYYDTNELVLPDLHNVNELVMTTDDRIKEKERLAEEIIQYYDNDEKITKDMIADYIEDRKLPKFLIKGIYVKIKQLEKERKKSEKED